jgi:hypothetical protein
MKLEIGQYIIIIYYFLQHQYDYIPINSQSDEKYGHNQFDPCFILSLLLSRIEGRNYDDGIFIIVDAIVVTFN